MTCRCVEPRRPGRSKCPSWGKRSNCATRVHCVWVVAEVGRDLGHAVGQGVQANVPGRREVHHVNGVLLVAGDPMDCHVTLVGGRTDGCPDVARRPCRGLLGGDGSPSRPRWRRRHRWQAQWCVPEAREGLEFGARDCLAAVEASEARDFRSQADPSVVDDEPVAATAVPRVTRLLAS